jgi:uncharacterized protein YceH (UPF0502 family)
VHFSELTAPEQRVLGCLIEKRWTTPEQYPLSLNALRLACNQSTNRDPVTHYDEPTVRDAAQRLSKYGLARLASGHSSRAIKYRHLAEEALGLGREELAVLCVLLLRGAQTPGELKGRSERMARFESLDAIDRVLDSLAQRGYVRRIDRRPGQKEDRFMHLLGGDVGAGVPAPESYGDRSAAPYREGAPASYREGPPASYGEGAPASYGEGAPASYRGGPPASYGEGAPASYGEGAPASYGEGAGVSVIGSAGAPEAATSVPPAPSATPAADGPLEQRVAALEAEVALLRAELEELRGSAGERQSDEVGGTTDDHAREGHFEPR